MKRRHHLAVEEALAVDVLDMAEHLVDKSSDYDDLYDQVVDEQAADADTADTEESDADIDESTNDDMDMTAAIEAFKQIGYDPALEEGEFTQALKTGGYYLKEFALMLGGLGLRYGPIALKKLYSGVAFIIGKILKLLFKSIISLSEYTDRTLHSFDNLKSDVAGLRKSLERAKVNEIDVTDRHFTNTRPINRLKIGDSVDLIHNLDIAIMFAKDINQSIMTRVSQNLSGINHLLSFSLMDLNKVPLTAMVDHISIDNLTHPNPLSGYEPSADHVSNVCYGKTLPGDVVFIAQLPEQSISDIAEVTRAYNGSGLFFGFNQGSFKEVESINYMTSAQLEVLLNKLEALCDLGLQHVQLHRAVIRKKQSIQHGFKGYVVKLLESTHKVSLSDSLAEHLYLKSMLVDKVYLAGSMDIQDYMSKIITSGISYAKGNIKSLG